MQQRRLRANIVEAVAGKAAAFCALVTCVGVGSASAAPQAQPAPKISPSPKAAHQTKAQVNAQRKPSAAEAAADSNMPEQVSDYMLRLSIWMQFMGRTESQIGTLYSRLASDNTLLSDDKWQKDFKEAAKGLTFAGQGMKDMKGIPDPCKKVQAKVVTIGGLLVKCAADLTAGVDNKKASQFSQANDEMLQATTVTKDVLKDTLQIKAKYGVK